MNKVIETLIQEYGLEVDKPFKLEKEDGEPTERDFVIKKDGLLYQQKELVIDTQQASYTQMDKLLGGLISGHFKVYKEPIKLKQWEYDVASYYHSDTNFDTWSTLIGLKEKGHFKGITNTLMTLKEILDNCIIVADDYDFGGNEND